MEPVTLGPAPALLARADRPRGTALLLHGLGADGLAGVKELAMLQGAGWNAIGVDAPMHGRRFDPARDARWVTERETMLRWLVTQSAAELPAVVDALAPLDLCPPYALMGISLGAYSVWRGLALEPRFSVGVPILGSPELVGEPKLGAGSLVDRAILAINAEHDEVVPLAPTLAFVEEMRREGARAEVSVIPRSPHAVPELHWWRVWGQTLAWLEAGKGVPAFSPTGRRPAPH